MTQLTRHFQLEEFAVSLSHPELVQPVPAQYWSNLRRLTEKCLQPIRDLWGKPMPVLSGYRTKLLNNAVAGSSTSQHLVAEAADIRTDGVRDLFLLLLTEDEEFPTGQLIFYPQRNFLHIAVPSSRYPSPSFFFSTEPKKYVRVSSYGAFNSLCPK